MGAGPTVVIGASSGMGHAVAQCFAQDGVPLLLADLDERSLAGIESELATAAEVSTVRLDLGDVDAVAALAERAGSFRSPVVTAGLSPTMGDAARILQVNLVGTVMVLDAFAPFASEGSVAVCFSSMAGHAPLAPDLMQTLDDPSADGFLDRVAAVDASALTDPAMAYIVSKAGVIRLVARGAAAWGTRGARVVPVSPGIIDRPMAKREAEAQPLIPEMMKQHPSGRAGRPEEVAEVVHFLRSPGRRT